MSKFPGTALREEREARGYSVHEVFEHIHVPVQHIQALEAGDVDALPGTTYALGFLSSYCQFLDLEPEPFLDRFRACRPSGASVGRTPQSRIPTGGWKSLREQMDARERPAWVSDLITWGAVCAVLLLGWLTYATVIQPLAENARARVEAVTTEAAPSPLFEEDF